MQIHDELIYEVGSCQVEAFQQLLRVSMETHIVQLLQLKVPLIINLHVGPSLGDLV
jgi:DNA polymerase I-like protein with 3'-5' exonuclease and polymerase domains